MKRFAYNTTATASAMLFIVAAMLVGAPASATAEQQQKTSCEAHDDCADDEQCIMGWCEPAEDTDSTELRAADEHADLAAFLDDGGADAACGSDRRCRIQRLRQRNQMRRHYDVAQQQKALEEEIDDLFAEEAKRVERIENPISVAVQYHPFGWGMVMGYTFDGQLRADFSVVYEDRRISYGGGTNDEPTLSGNHQVWYGTGHITYLPSRAWFSPLVSAGFGMGGGEFNDANNPGVRYHYLTGAVGAEGQFDSGMLVRTSFRYGRLLYNQARRGPGDYDERRRQALREYVNDETMIGFDFAIGWAF